MSSLWWVESVNFIGQIQVSNVTKGECKLKMMKDYKETALLT